MHAGIIRPPNLVLANAALPRPVELVPGVLRGDLRHILQPGRAETGQSVGDVGGVPYEEFLGFHAVMAEDSGQTVLPVVVDMILPLAPGLVEAMKAGIEVMDIGCGSGRALNKMAEHFLAWIFPSRLFRPPGAKHNPVA